MFRPQLRQISRHGERVRLNLLSSSRQFSVTPAVAAEGQGQGQPSGMSLYVDFIFSLDFRSCRLEVKAN